MLEYKVKNSHGRCLHEAIISYLVLIHHVYEAALVCTPKKLIESQPQKDISQQLSAIITITIKANMTMMCINCDI